MKSFVVGTFIRMQEVLMLKAKYISCYLIYAVYVTILFKDDRKLYLSPSSFLSNKFHTIGFPVGTEVVPMILKVLIVTIGKRLILKQYICMYLCMNM